MKPFDFAFGCGYVASAFIVAALLSLGIISSAWYFAIGSLIGWLAISWLLGVEDS